MSPAGILAVRQRGASEAGVRVGEYFTELPCERLAKYRLMAAQAHGRAANACSPEVKGFYTSIAMAWETMTAELERSEAALQRRQDSSRRPSGPRA